MEGVAAVVENRARESVYRFTVDRADIQLMANAAERAGHDKITFEVKAQGFVASENSKRAGDTFHSWVARHWAPKPKA